MDFGQCPFSDIEFLCTKWQPDVIALKLIQSQMLISCNALTSLVEHSNTG